MAEDIKSFSQNYLRLSDLLIIERKMKKEEYIAKYGEDAYKKKSEETLARAQAWKKAHPEECKVFNKKYRETHPEQIKANEREEGRKGGKYYEKKLGYNRTGLQGARNKVRAKHQYQYHPFKRIIAPDSQLHHEWIPKTAEYRGVALVEKDPHQYGIIDVIQILDGTITLLTEEDVKKGK